MSNPILRELHDIRRQLLAEHGGDLNAYLQAELERTKASGHPVAQIIPRTIRRSPALELEAQPTQPFTPSSNIAADQ